jgi:hypothetical protein
VRSDFCQIAFVALGVVHRQGERGVGRQRREGRGGIAMDRGASRDAAVDERPHRTPRHTASYRSRVTAQRTASVCSDRQPPYRYRTTVQEPSAQSPWLAAHRAPATPHGSPGILRVVERRGRRQRVTPVAMAGGGASRRQPDARGASRSLCRSRGRCRFPARSRPRARPPARGPAVLDRCWLWTAGARRPCWEPPWR